MRVVQLRHDARSTRIYFTNCYSYTVVDHVNFANNILMIMLGYCEQDFVTILEPKAVLNLCDYPGNLADLPSDKIPVFHIFK